MNIFEILVKYIPLWASCMTICLGATLLLVLRLSKSLTNEMQVLLLRLACYAGLVFLLCTGQWIYAFFLLGFMLDKHDTRFRMWLHEPSEKSLRTAYLLLLLSGCLGLVDALDLYPVLLRPLAFGLRYPAVSIGLIVAMLVVFCWSGFVSARGSQN